VKSLKRSDLLRKLLLRHKSSNRLWASLIALCTGTTLLLLSVLIWWNFQQVLSGKSDNDSLGSTFLTIGKNVTNDMVGKPEASLFRQEEIQAISTAPQVQDMGALVSNRFPVYAIMNAGGVGFSTEMFLEAVPERFIDKTPEGWQWEPGNKQVPIILSSDFLNLYNYGFALSQGLPQLSRSSIKALAFEIRIGRGEHTESYVARIAGFSDRINSVLVPSSFVEYGNKTFAPNITFAPSRLIVKVKDPSDKAFVQFLQSKDYTTNAEQLRWNKLRGVIDAVTGATGLLALLLMGIGTLVFILFIELTIVKAAPSLSLLLQLGYSPKYLSLFMLRKFVPLVLIALGISAALACVAQSIVVKQATAMGLSLPNIPGWPMWAALGISTGILLLFISRSIVKAIR
jgi:hypothetical protein